MRKMGFVGILGVLVLCSCASMFIKGGDLASAGYVPQKILVRYSVEGAAPQGVEYQLVETEKGTAIFERSGDGSGALFLTRWQDSQGDHFAGWVATSHGYEFVIPKDRTKKGKKYVYPKGYYSIQDIDGIERPVPATPIDAVATLIPKR